jgi:predicted TIM-barrel fold metal-dependent hydrolase
MLILALLVPWLGPGSLPAGEEPAEYKSSYRVINVHAHCAVPSEEAMQAEFEVLDRVGVDRIVVLDGGSPEGTLPAWLKLREKYPNRLTVFMKLSFKRIAEPTFFTDIVRELESAAKSGVQGVKVWKDLGMYVRDPGGRLLKADDKRLDPFWEKCGELGLPVLIHAADPKEYWYPLTYNSFHYGMRPEKDQFYNDPEMPTWEELIERRNNILEKHPRTKFIGAHMGSLSFDLKQLEVTLEKYPNFSVDCAARQRILGRLNPAAVRDFFVKHQDRILFGTDGILLLAQRRPTGSANISVYPSDDPNWVMVDLANRAAVRAWQQREAESIGLYLKYFETDLPDLSDPSRSGGPWLKFPGIKLPAEVLEKFYHGNAEKLIPGLKP